MDTFSFFFICSDCTNQLEKAAQGVAQCKVSATRVVVDAALLSGGDRIANISRDCERI